MARTDKLPMANILISAVFVASLFGTTAITRAQTPAAGASRDGNVGPSTTDLKLKKVSDGITTGIGPGQQAVARNPSGRGSLGPANYNNVGLNSGGK